MTNRTREIFDFAQHEPVAVDDLALMLGECTEDEIEEVELVAGNLTTAINKLDVRFDGIPDYDTEFI